MMLATRQMIVIIRTVRRALPKAPAPFERALFPSRADESFSTAYLSLSSASVS